MYTRLYVYKPTGTNMAKLYWRYKKEGKWTWKPLEINDEFTMTLIDRLRTSAGVE